MGDGMTDRQLQAILRMVDMILDGCKDLQEARERLGTLRDIFD